MRSYTIWITENKKIDIRADEKEISLNWKMISFSRNGKIIASFVLENIIGYTANE